MTPVLATKKSNCKNCYKCIRQCPVKSIGFRDNQAYILTEDCIHCGNCYVVCPQNAKEILGEAGLVKAAIASGRRVYASVAPSFLASFPYRSIEPLVAQLKALGFYDVQETAIGAEIVKKQYEALIQSKTQDVVISTCCASVNALVERYYPKVVQYLAPFLSPMQAHCKVIKEGDPEAMTVFIGPCISKKKEAMTSPYTDVALTFQDIYDWMEEVNLPVVPDDTMEDSGKRTRYFPVAGGILRSMEKNPDFFYICVDGAEDCISVLEELSSRPQKKVFIEMSTCSGSCINGPVSGPMTHKTVRANMKIRNYAGYEEYNVTESMDVSYTYEGTKIPQVQISDEVLQEILMKIGKKDAMDQLNCGSCGYNTCKDKALAVTMGKANLSMCLPYLKEKAENFSENILNNTRNAVVVMNEELMIQQVNPAALKMFHLQDASYIVNEPVSTILHPLDFIEVMESGQSIYDKKEYLPEYKKYIEQTVVYDPSYHLVIAIMKDITGQETEKQSEKAMKKETVEIADQVIQKQLRVVQEIASLLGETAAETKIALTNLKNVVDQ